MPGEDNRKNCDSTSSTQWCQYDTKHIKYRVHGANMTQRILNGRWCKYNTEDIKCQLVPVIDVVSVVMASAILAPCDL